MKIGGTPGRNRTDVAALIWRVLSPGYKAGALTNISYRGVSRLGRSRRYSEAESAMLDHGLKLTTAVGRSAYAGVSRE